MKKWRQILQILGIATICIVCSIGIFNKCKSSGGKELSLGKYLAWKTNSELVPEENGTVQGSTGNVSAGDTAENASNHSSHQLNSVFIPATDTISFDESASTLFYEDMIVVYLSGGLSDKEKEKLAKSVQGRIVGQISGAANVLQLSIDANTLSKIQKCKEILESNPNVVYADCEYPVPIAIESASSTADDPWSEVPTNPDTDRGNEDAPGGNDWWAEAIGLYSAWSHNLAPRGYKVGVVDTGFFSEHIELRGKLHKFYSDGNTYRGPHGTAVCGFIASAKNGYGIRGVMDEASISFFDIGNQNGELVTPSTVILSAIEDMVEDNIQVINCSWGIKRYSLAAFTKNEYNAGGIEDTVLRFLSLKLGSYNAYRNYIDTVARRTSIESLFLISSLIKKNKDFIIVQAAGNGIDNSGGNPPLDNYSLPIEANGFFCGITPDLYMRLSPKIQEYLSAFGADYDSVKSRVMIVTSATEERDTLGNYAIEEKTHYGAAVDIAAPGDNLLCVSDSGITSFAAGKSGTSFAAPIAAGSIAMVWANFPEMSGPEVKQEILRGSLVQAYGVGNEDGFRCPMLNIGQTMRNLFAASEIKPENPSITGVETEEGFQMFYGTSKAKKARLGRDFGAVLFEDGVLAVFGQFSPFIVNDSIGNMHKVMDNVADFAITSSCMFILDFNGDVYIVGQIQTPFYDLENTGVLVNKDTGTFNEPTLVLNDVASIDTNPELFAATFVQKDGTLWFCSSMNVEHDLEHKGYYSLQILDHDVKKASIGNSTVLEIKTDGGLYIWGSDFEDPYQLIDITENGHTYFYDTPRHVKAIMDTTLFNNVTDVDMNGEYMFIKLFNGHVFLKGYDIKCESDDIIYFDTGYFERAGIIDRNHNLWITSKEYGTSYRFWEFEQGEHVLSDVIDVSVNDSRCIAITKDGKVWIWGENGMIMLNRLGGIQEEYIQTPTILYEPQN